jgi:hypothetical protein
MINDRGGGFLAASGSGSGGAWEVVESGRTSSTPGGGWITVNIPITGSYDPTKYFPRLKVHGTLYDTAGTQTIQYLTCKQDFASNQIVVLGYSTSAVAIKFPWEIVYPGGRPVQQAAPAFNFGGSGLEKTATATLSVALSNYAKAFVVLGGGGAPAYAHPGSGTFAYGVDARITASDTLTLWASSNNLAANAATIPYVVIY